MKKYLLILALIVAALSSYARVEVTTTNNSVLLSSIQGSYHKIDTLAAYFSGTQYRFVPNQDIPNITIGSTEYAGYLDEELNRIYWPINITADEALPTEDTFKKTTISFDLTKVKTTDGDDGSQLSLGDIATQSNFLKISREIALSKYLIDNPSDNYLTSKYLHLFLSYPSKFSDPSAGSKRYLKGKYEVSLNSVYKNDYYVNSATAAVNYDGTTIPFEAVVVNEDGTEVDRFEAHVENYSTFTTVIDRPITTDGKYYIIYEYNGRVSVPNKTYSASYVLNLSPVKVGPYTIDSSSEDITYKRGMLSLVPFESQLYTDNLPDEWRIKVDNAVEVFQRDGSDLSEVSIQCLHSSDIIAEFTPELRFNGNEVVIPLDKINATILNRSTPAGTYSLKLPAVGNFLSGYTANAETIIFPTSSNATATYRIADPKPEANLNAYVKTTADEIELPEGEEITLKLNTDSGTTHEIFFRWTPEESPVTFSSRAADTSGNDFTKHTGVITVAGPGTLEYYTRLSNTNSEVKSITVVTKAPEEDPDISTDIADITTDTDEEEGEMIYYRLDGSRAADLSSPGIYIGKSASGATRKVLVK